MPKKKKSVRSIARASHKEIDDAFNRIMRIDADELLLDRQLDRVGPAMIDLCRGGKSFRSLARKANLSPTYISLVVNGRQRISRESFLAIYEIYQEQE